MSNITSKIASENSLARLFLFLKVQKIALQGYFLFSASKEVLGILFYFILHVCVFVSVTVLQGQFLRKARGACLALSTRKSLAIAIVRFWCAKVPTIVFRASGGPKFVKNLPKIESNDFQTDFSKFRQFFGKFGSPRVESPKNNRRDIYFWTNLGFRVFLNAV